MPVSIFISKNYSGVALCSPGAHPCCGRAWGPRGGRGGGVQGERKIDAENEKTEKKKKKRQRRGSREALGSADDCLSLVSVCVCIMSHQ